MIGVVDPAARIGVFVPGAADIGVLLDDLERDAGLLQADAGEKARHAGADHNHMQLFSRGFQLRRVPFRQLGIAIECKFFLQEGDVVFRDRRTDDVIHHPAQCFGRGLVWRLFAGRHVVRNHLFSEGHNLRLFFFREAANPAVAEEIIDRRLVRGEMIGIAGHVHQGNHQGRQMRFLKGLFEQRQILSHGVPQILLCVIAIVWHS